MFLFGFILLGGYGVGHAEGRIAEGCFASLWGRCGLLCSAFYVAFHWGVSLAFGLDSVGDTVCADGENRGEDDREE